MNTSNELNEINEFQSKLTKLLDENHATRRQELHEKLANAKEVIEKSYEYDKRIKAALPYQAIDIEENEEKIMIIDKLNKIKSDIFRINRDVVDILKLLVEEPTFEVK